MNRVFCDSEARRWNGAGGRAAEPSSAAWDIRRSKRVILPSTDPASSVSLIDGLIRRSGFAPGMS